MFEEGIDRPAQLGEFGHDGGKVLILEGLFDVMAHAAERLVERNLLIRPGIDQRAVDFQSLRQRAFLLLGLEDVRRTLVAASRFAPSSEPRRRRVLRCGG